MIKNFYLLLSWPNWLFALLVVGLIAIAYLYYLRTLPPLSPGRRIPLMVIRALSLIILLFLILEPIIKVLYQNTEKPVVAVLLDNSASMKIKENYGQRGDSLKYIADRLDRLNPSDSLELSAFKFALSLQGNKTDSLNFEEDGTNLTNVITAVNDSLSGRNLQALILVSDGIYNQGPNPVLPARQSPAPIHTVLVGDTSQPKDIAIRRVKTNQVIYVNNKMPMEVVVTQNGYDGQKVLLSVTRDGEQVAERMITLGRSGFEQKEILDIVAETTGDFNYQVSVRALPGEVTTHNNQKITRVRVLKSKIKVLVLSGAPNFDRHFLSFISTQLEDFQFTFLTEKGRGDYFEQTFQTVPIDSQDLFIFHGFPTSQSDPVQLKRIMEKVQQKQIPIFWFVSGRTNFQKLNPFAGILAVQMQTGLVSTENQFVRLTSGGRLHPVTKLDENVTANDLIWNELPPIESFRRVKMREGAQLLLRAQDQEGRASGNALPICFAYRQQEIKQLVFNGANFGNWHFQLQEDPTRDQFFKNFIDRSVRWLVSREDIHQVQIKPLQQIYNVGEQIIFSGQVYDEFYQPISDAQVVVTVNNDTLEFSDEMFAEGNGFYRQSFSGLPEGEFNYRVEASRNDQQIGVRTGKFTINPFFLEFQQIPANYSLMQQLAEQSGGKAYRPASFVKDFSGKELESRTRLTSSEFFVWNYILWLAILILLLATEWFLRKRWGLL